MEIKFDAGKRLYTNAIRHRFIQGENLAESITITGPRQVGALDLSQLRMAVRVNSPTYETTVEKTLSQTVQGESISLEWVVDKTFTAAPGPVSVTLVGYGNEEEVIKITSDGILVKADDINGTAPPESTWEQLLAEMQQFATETYQNAQAAAASEANAKASEAAAAASAQDAQASKTAAAASAEEAKNAAATAAQEAAEQAAAQAAAQTEAQIRSYADDRYARALKATDGPAEELTIYPDEGSSLQITVHGATTQEGSGDPSPSNVRPIKGTGRKMATVVLDGTSVKVVHNETWTNQNENGIAFFYVQAQNMPTPAKQKTTVINDVFPIRNTFNQTASEEGIAVLDVLYIAIKKEKLNPVTSTQMNLWLQKNPLTVRYVPEDASQATEWYTWEAVDGDTYAAVGLPLNGQLYDGDKVSNDATSGYDKIVVFDGSEDEQWSISQEGTTSKRFGLINGAPNAVGGKGNCAASSFTVSSGPAEALQNFAFITVYSSGFVDANVPGIDTVEDWRQYLSQHPETLYYKSKSYREKTAMRILMEIHGDVMYTLTGEESYQHVDGWTPGAIVLYSFFGGVVSVPEYNIKAEIVCSHLATNTAEQVTGASNKQGCAQGGGANLFLNFGDPYNTKELAVQYIKDQYAAGTPVQIKAKRATPAVYAHPRQILIANPDTEGKVTVTGEGQVSAAYNKSITRAIAELQAAALALGANLSI